MRARLRTQPEAPWEVWEGRFLSFGCPVLPSQGRRPLCPVLGGTGTRGVIISGCWLPVLLKGQLINVKFAVI